MELSVGECGAGSKRLTTTGRSSERTVQVACLEAEDHVLRLRVIAAKGAEA